MEAIIFTSIGAIFGWVITHLYSKSGDKKIDDLKREISAPLNALLEKEGAIQALLEKAIQELGKEHSERAKEISCELSKHQEELIEAVKRVEETASVSLNHAPIERSISCYRCGKLAHQAGFAGGPGGGWVMWYTCPEHGRFPGAHIDDMLED